MLPLSAWIQIAGVVQLAIGIANLPLANRLQYRKNLAGISAWSGRSSTSTPPTS